jgi:hypothetical protein
MHFTLSTLIQNILIYPILIPIILYYNGDYTVVKPCLASVFSFMLLEFRFGYQFKTNF